MRPLLAATMALIFTGMLSGPAEAAPKYPFGKSARTRKAASKRAAGRPARPVEAPSELEEEDEPPPPPRRTPTSKQADAAEEEEPDGKRARTQTENQRLPPRRGANRDDDDDDEDAPDAPITSLSSITPRLISGFVGLSVVGRSFETGATLQRESALGRSGPALAFESYPLLTATRGALKKLGIAAAYTMEFGTAAVQYTNGSTVSFGVRQSRWVVDLRYAFTPGSRVVLIPMLGLGNSSYDLQRPMQPMPSGCVRGPDTLPCLPDSVLTHFKLGLLARIAVNADVALSIAVNLLPVLNVGKSPGQSGAESVDVQSLGYGGELGLNWALTSWIDLRAAIPIIRFGQKFSGNMVMTTYPTGTEMVYGTTLGVVAHTL
jgi:hypothetical protein